MSYLGCFYDYGPEAYRHIERKARKAHRCCECSGVIQPKETYHYHSGIWEGEPDDFKICSDCQKLKDKMNAELTDHCLLMEGGISEELSEGNWKPEYYEKFKAIQARRAPTQEEK